MAAGVDARAVPADDEVMAGLSANHDAAIGNVAPIAAAGTAMRPRLSAARASVNRSGASPSMYAQAMTGASPCRPAGNAIANSAIRSSSAAYTTRRCSRSAPVRPPSQAPADRPPMNAASTMLIAATVCPMSSVRSLVHVTS